MTQFNSVPFTIDRTGDRRRGSRAFPQRALVTVGLLFASTAVSVAQPLEFRFERESATEEEAALRGQGDYLRDKGRFLESRSEAYQRYQDGERTRIENARILEEYTRSHRMAATLAWRERRLGATQPRRVTAKALTVEGTILWPDLLLRPEFAESRQHVEQLFSERARASSWELPKLTAKIQAAAGDLRSTLDELVLEISPVAHLRGARFLRNLAYESTFSPSRCAPIEDRLAID